MKTLKNNIIPILQSEDGGPNVEQVMGIAVALAVGVGLFIFGSSVFDWFNGSAKKTVDKIDAYESADWSI